MDHLQKKGEWSCGEMENGEQCVMTGGAWTMPMWSVECWDIQELVKHHAVLGMDQELEG